MNNMPNNNPNFPNFQALLDYIKATPAWLLGFVDGEGCFTASFMLYTKGTWGITPQCEFNVTQSSQDSILLDVINAFFGIVGTVHHKIGGVSVVAFRSISALCTVIIPFFLKHPLVSLKNNHFITWSLIVAIMESKQHVGNTLLARDKLLEMARIMVTLNASTPSLGRGRSNSKKLARLYIIIDWLESLSAVPTLAQKLELRARIAALSNNENSDE